jgi:hypothetical protein
MTNETQIEEMEEMLEETMEITLADECWANVIFKDDMRTQGSLSSEEKNRGYQLAKVFPQSKANL